MMNSLYWPSEWFSINNRVTLWNWLTDEFSLVSWDSIFKREESKITEEISGEAFYLFGPLAEFSSKSRCHSLGTLGSSSFMSCTRELSSQEERRRGKGAQTLKIDLTAGQEKKGKKNGRRVSGHTSRSLGACLLAVQHSIK